MLINVLYKVVFRGCILIKVDLIIHVFGSRTKGATENVFKILEDAMHVSFYKISELV